MSGRVIETFFVDYDADMAQIAEKYERPEFELLVFGRFRKRGPVGTRWSSLKVDANILERAPNQSGTIELVRTRPIKPIAGSDVRLNRREQCLIKTIG